MAGCTEEPGEALTEKQKKRAKWNAWHKRAMSSNPEFRARRLEQKRADYQRHKEARIAVMQKWAAANRDKVRNIAKAHYRKFGKEDRARKNQDLMRAARKRWAQKNPEFAIGKEGRRRAQKRKTQVGPVDIKRIRSSANGICGICKCHVGDEPTEIDHIVPLSRGGSHTQDNLQLAHASCNRRKGAKAPEQLAG